MPDIYQARISDVTATRRYIARFVSGIPVCVVQERRGTIWWWCPADCVICENWVEAVLTAADLAMDERRTLRAQMKENNGG